MTNPLTSLQRVSALFAAAALFAGCGDSSPTASAAAAGPRGDIDRCALLTDDEVAGVIGPHGGGSTGSNDRPNKWGFDACRWTSLASRHIEGIGNWSDAIEVSVFAGHREAWARDQAEGEPVEGLGEGALYDASFGELWFNCGARFCAIKIHTASANDRDQAARRLALIVQGRVAD